MIHNSKIFIINIKKRKEALSIRGDTLSNDTTLSRAICIVCVEARIHEKGNSRHVSPRWSLRSKYIIPLGHLLQKPTEEGRVLPIGDHEAVL